MKGSGDAAITYAETGSAVSGRKILAANSFETGVADETTITLANSDDGGAGNAFNVVVFGAGSAVFDTARAAHGTRSARLTAASPGTPIYLGWQVATVGTRTEIFGRAYIYKTAHPSGNQYPILFLDGASNRCGLIYWGNDGSLFVFNQSLGVSDGGTVGWQLNAWNRVEFRLVCGTTTGSLEARLYAGDSTTLLDVASISNTDTLTSVAQVLVGDSSGATASNVTWVDDVQVNLTGWPGPVSQDGLTANGTKSVTYTKTGGARRNLLDNGSVDVNLNGWAVQAGTPTIAADTTTARYGSRSARLTLASAEEVRVTLASGTRPSFPASTKGTVSFWARSASGAVFRVNVRYYDGSGVLQATYNFSFAPTDTWELISLTTSGASPASTTTAQVTFELHTGVGDNDLLVDGVILQAATEPRLYSSRSASGVKSLVAGVTYTKTGAGIRDFTGTGDGRWDVRETGTAISERKASGADAITFAETGSAISERKASGADAVTYAETGTGISERKASGADATTYVEVGTGNLPFNGDFETSATGWNATANASVARSTEQAHAGVASLKVITNGVAANEGTNNNFDVITPATVGQSYRATQWLYDATGGHTVYFGLIWNLDGASAGNSLGTLTTVSGWQQVSHQAVAPAGVNRVSFLGIRTWITPQAATFYLDEMRLSVVTPVFSGSGFASLIAGITYTKAGSGIAEFTGTGASAITYAETGAGVSERTGTGAGAWTVAETGIGISARIGAGAKNVTYAETGAGISARIASGADAHTAAETGAGIAPFTGTGLGASTTAETGIAISARVASGVRNVTLSRAGTAQAPFTASGADATTYAETGTGISARVASGARNVNVNRTGTAISGRVATGPGDEAQANRGTAESGFTGTGAATWTLNRTGTAASEFTVAGAASSDSPRAGTAATEFKASGVRASAFAETGTGIASFTVSGTDAVTLTRAGTAITVFTVSGLGYKPVFLRPDSDISTGTWHDTPLYEKIDEILADTGDFITSGVSPISPDIAEMTLSDVDDPQRSYGHFVRYGIRKDIAGGDALTFTIRLMEGTTEIASWTRAVPTSATVYEEALTTGQADSITDYTNLRVKVEAEA